MILLFFLLSAAEEHQDHERTGEDTEIESSRAFQMGHPILQAQDTWEKTAAAEDCPPFSLYIKRIHI